MRRLQCGAVALCGARFGTSLLCRIDSLHTAVDAAVAEMLAKWL